MVGIREDGRDFQSEKGTFGRDFDQIFERGDDAIDAPGCRSLDDFCQVRVRVMMVVRKPLSRLNM